MNMTHVLSDRAALRLLPVLLAAPLLLIPVACGGPSSTATQTPANAGAQLQTISFGRLVDIYAYQRIDPARGDRRDRLNRRAVLVEQNVVVRAGITSDSLYDPAGDESPTANFEFQPFSVATGHDELVILWDNRGDEKARFDQALTLAQLGLTEVPASVRTQNTSQRPIPVIPRDAAIVLSFGSPIGLPQSFFDVNVAAVQLLEYAGDPHVVAPQDAFRAVPFRLIAKGKQIILDPTILGGEAQGGFLAPGLPTSVDNTTANIRVAIPSRGSVSSQF